MEGQGAGTLKKTRQALPVASRGRPAKRSRAARVPKDPVAAWEQVLADGVLYREELDAKHLPLAVAAFRARYGDDLFLEILRDMWTADWVYGEIVRELRRQLPQEEERGWIARPWLGARVTGPLVFSSPTFWEDWRIFTQELKEARRGDPKRAKVLQASARSFVTAALSFGYEPKLGRPRDKDLREELRDSEPIAAAIRGDPARLPSFLKELALKHADEQRLVEGGDHGRIGRFVSIVRHRPNLRGDFEKLELAEATHQSLIRRTRKLKSRLKSVD